ncbi:hypothetical protein [Campylobacter concisus]|nr:hypothetical protein [Campylobacter concisus]
MNFKIKLKIGKLPHNKDMWINLEFFAWEIYITDSFFVVVRGCNLKQP